MTTKDQNTQKDESIEFITKEQAEKNQPKSTVWQKTCSCVTDASAITIFAATAFIAVTKLIKK
jgi:hypothetical protein